MRLNKMRQLQFFITATVLVLIIFYISLSWGNHFSSPLTVFQSLFTTPISSYEQAAIIYQRLPRALIALYAGAILATSGLVFQTLIRNPLASSSSLGVNAGATFFVVASALIFNVPLSYQAIFALLGGISGFLLCFAIARLARQSGNSQNSNAYGLALILSGTLVAMLLIGLSNALLLAYPARRSEFLSWIAGNINHVYIDRLYQFWWIGGLSFCMIFLLTKPLTLILLGNDKAISMGVRVTFISRLALTLAIISSSAAVAVCGPISFIGLVVPHMIRPLVGQNFKFTFPASALLGAILCLIASLLSQNLFTPFIINTGVILDLLGGLVFILLIRKFYILPAKARSS